MCTDWAGNFDVKRGSRIRKTLPECMITLMNAAQSVNGSLLTTSPWLQEKHVVPLSFCLETSLGTFNVTLDMM